MHSLFILLIHVKLNSWI